MKSQSVGMGNICVSMVLFVSKMMTMNSGVIVHLINSTPRVFIASILLVPIAAHLISRTLGIEDFAPTVVNATLILMGEPIFLLLVEHVC
jgi:hypothetical protein